MCEYQLFRLNEPVSPLIKCMKCMKVIQSKRFVVEESILEEKTETLNPENHVWKENTAFEDQQSMIIFFKDFHLAFLCVTLVLNGQITAMNLTMNQIILVLICMMIIYIVYISTEKYSIERCATFVNSFCVQVSNFRCNCTVAMEKWSYLDLISGSIASWYLVLNSLYLMPCVLDSENKKVVPPVKGYCR